MARNWSGRLAAVALLGVLCLGLAGSALAAPRDEAKRAFHNGMRLLEEGQVDQGIAELELAYEILPHPNVLFNIGRAYHDAGRIGDAVRYFRLYLESEPPDVAEVRQVLINEAQKQYDEGMVLIREGNYEAGIDHLETAHWIWPRASVLYNIGRAFEDLGQPDRAIPFYERYLDTNPPDHFEVRQLIVRLRQRVVDADETGAGGEPAVAEVPPEQLAEMRELAERMERAWERHESRPVTAAAPDDLGGELAGRTTEEILAGKSIEELYEEKVVSASRQTTRPLEAPVSTHIITAEDIRMAGVASIPELLRMVPGLEVMQMGPANFNVAIRGFNQRMANKVLVLIDGRSIYFDFLMDTTFWKTLSVNLLDIERIEVIRGPGATMYGANAFSGVVNIITRPRGEEALQVGGLAGMGETVLGEVRYSDRIKSVGYSISVGYEQTDRFELEYDPNRQDVIYQVSDPTLALRALRANGGISWLPRDDTTISLSGGVCAAYWDFYAMGLLRNYYITGVLPHVRLDIRHKGFGLRVFYNHLNLPEAGYPTTQPGSLDHVFNTSGITDVVDVEATYSGELNLGLRHQLAGSVGFRAKNIRDFDYLDDDHFERHLNGSIEDTIHIQDWARAVLGFRFDVHPLVGFTPSPRVALIFKPTSRMAVRVSAGTAFRIPSFTESYLDLPVPGPASGVAILSQGNVDLKPEQMRSVELGYRFEGSDYFMFDIAGYYQRVNDLIALGEVTAATERADYGDYFVAGTTGFVNVDQPFAGIGVEPALHLFPARGLDISVNYAFQYLIDLERFRADEPAWDKRGPMHKLNAGVQYRTPFNIDFHVWCHFVGAYTIAERAFDSGGKVYLEEFAMDPFVILNARILLHAMADRIEFGVTIQNLTGFFVEQGGHKEHELGTTVRPRVFGTVRLSF